MNGKKDPVDRFRGRPLTGLGDLRGTLDGEDVVIACSGPTFQAYDDTAVPAHVKRVAINETIKKFSEISRPPGYWVFSDIPVVQDYHKFHDVLTTCLVMHEATVPVRKFVDRSAPVFTVNSMSKIREYDNPYQFFSRSTVLIGAVEMLRYMGVRRFFIFGADAFRTRRRYYYDAGRKPRYGTERRVESCDRVFFKGAPEPIYATPKLKKMVDQVARAAASGLWDGLKLYCVASPYSQHTALEKISLEDAIGLMDETGPGRKEPEPVSFDELREPVSFDELREIEPPFPPEEEEDGSSE